MRREYASIAAMGAILVGSQVIAILLAPLFLTGGFQAFPNPSDVTNTAVYIVLILAFTGVILLLVRFRRQNVAKYVILASIFVTLAFILLLPLYVGLYYATGQPMDDNQLAFLANLSTLLSFLIAGGLIYLLVKFPEWYVVDAIGIVTAAGVTAILGISFGILPAVLLLVALTFLGPLSGSSAGLPGSLLVAIGSVIGSLGGFLVLMRFVLKGNPQAGLPLLNGGALLGFLITSLLVYGHVTIL